VEGVFEGWKSFVTAADFYSYLINLPFSGDLAFYQVASPQENNFYYHSYSILMYQNANLLSHTPQYPDMLISYLSS
jgi:hypothetical protein